MNLENREVQRYCRQYLYVLMKTDGKTQMEKYLDNLPDLRII
jgi:hypothetical protein